MNSETAQDHRDAAASALRKREESFERSDTDGFLSQWAHDLTAREHEANARILNEGGTSEFRGLYEGDRRVKAAQVRVYDKFAHCSVSKWVVDDEDPVCAKRKWIPCGSRSRVQNGLGLCERAERAPARAKLDGNEGGNVYVSIYRTGCRYGSDATLV